MNLRIVESPAKSKNINKYRRPPRRRLSCAARARLFSRLYPLAGPVAQAPRLALGRPRAVSRAPARLRPRARDRNFHSEGILVDPGIARDPARRDLRSAPRW